MDIAQTSTVSEKNLITTQNSCLSDSSCNESFSKQAFSINGELNSQKKYKCAQCDSKFFRYPHLQDHLNRHTGDRKYQCKEKNCTKAYFAWKHLRKHLIASHKLDDVKKSSYRKKESDESGGKGHKCSYEGCNAVYDRHWKLTSHMCKHTGEKPYPCNENGCNKAYTTVGHLRRHVKSHKPNNKMVVTEYSCYEFGCEKVYKTVESVRRHHSIHHNKTYKCTSCDKNFFSLKMLGHHKCESFKCEECNFKCKKVGTWKNHMKKVHLLHKCSVRECSKVFPLYSSLKEHREAEHKKYYQCPICNKKVSSKAQKDHQETHLLPEEKRFPCPVDECSRFYTRKFNLDQHIRSSHEDIKFECTFPGCEKRLVTKQKLQEHMKLHDPHREPVQRKQIARRQRKDAGQPKRSMAVKLSGVCVSYKEEQIILNSGNKLESSQYTSKPDDTCSEASEVSEDLSEMSETEKGGQESDVCNESCVMTDSESSTHSELIEGLTGADDNKTQMFSIKSDQVRSVPMEQVEQCNPLEYSNEI